MKLTEAIEAALIGAGKADLVMQTVQPAVADIAKQMGNAFKASGKEELKDFLTGDAETDQLTMSGLALANEINSETDWAAVPLDIISAAYTALKAGLAIAAVFA